MRKILLIPALYFLFGALGYSQVDDTEEALRTQNADTIMGWKAGGKITLNFSQAGFKNWAAGGDNSISGIGNLNMFLNYIQENYHWTNRIEIGYGLQKFKKDISKTDDKLYFTSKYGHKAKRHWYYSALVDFKTQMAVGYDSDDENVKISNWMAPGYLFFSAGMDYIPNENLSFFISPVTYRATFVLDQALADSGSFGVDPGKNIRSEFGAYLKFFFKHEIMKNVTFQTNLDLFSNYLEHPENIDVDWKVLFDLKVNKLISASISTHLIYDDDIKIRYDSTGDGNKDSEGPRVQFKEIIAVGLSVSF